MSHLSLNRKRNSQANNLRSRIITQAAVCQNDKQNFNIEQNIAQNINSIRDTLTMLRQYEKLCIEKEDYLMAQQTKNKIQFLQKQQRTIQKQRGVLRQQQTIGIICRQGQQQVQGFQQYWDQTITKLMQQLKQIQNNLKQQQQSDLQQYRQKLINQQIPKIKYSGKVLELRKNLSNLIKIRKYKQADQTKNKLKVLQTQCQSLWNIQNQNKIHILIQKFIKKQSHQLNTLRTKLQTIFNQKIKQRDHKFQILLKRNRKRKIQSSKSKLKNLKQSSYSKSKSQSRIALGNSKMSNFNCSTKC